MHGPEDPVDQVVILGILLQLQQGGLQLRQQFSGFFAVSGYRLFHHGQNPLAGRLTQYLLNHSDQLLRLERLDDPAGGTGGLAFLLA